MPPVSNTDPSVAQQDSGAIVRLGGWLFRKRTLLPVPLAAGLLLIRPRAQDVASPWLPIAGATLVAVGELIRLWGVRHIGTISRTRSDRLGPLVDSGPFAIVRNPLYIGNILLWLGFALAARLPWVAPFVLLLLAGEYHAIVRWEERLLEARMGAPYSGYLKRVPRWIPTGASSPTTSGGQAFSWSDTLHSERGTLIAIGLGYALLALKAAFM